MSRSPTSPLTVHAEVLNEPSLLTNGSQNPSLKSGPTHAAHLLQNTPRSTDPPPIVLGSRQSPETQVSEEEHVPVLLVQLRLALVPLTDPEQLDVPFSEKSLPLIDPLRLDPSLHVTLTVQVLLVVTSHEVVGHEPLSDQLPVRSWQDAPPPPLLESELQPSAKRPPNTKAINRNSPRGFMAIAYCETLGLTTEFLANNAHRS